MNQPHSAVLVDLLMAVMNSLDVWAGAAGDRQAGLRWRDEVTRRMAASTSYVPYEELVAEAAADLGLSPTAPADLGARWATMKPWSDSAALDRLTVPFAFVTNTSRELAQLAAGRSGLSPTFTLSAEEAGWYKPQPAIYRLACERIGAAPAQVRYIAGSPYDAEGARRAGLQPVLVRRRVDQAPPTDLTIPVVASITDALT